METGDKLIRLSEVKKRVGLGRSSIYKFFQLGIFPKPVQLGPRAVAWRASEIDTWIATRPVV